MKKTILIAVATGCLFVASCRVPDEPIKIEYPTEPCFIPTKVNRFKLCDNMIVHIDAEYHAVPRGFKTDLASIPRIFWPVFSPGDYDSIASAVLHDWHYCCSVEVDRKRADLIFYYGLQAQGMSQFKAYIYYMGVRAVGWAFYRHGEGMKDHEGQFDKAELQGVYDDVNYRLG
jgi:hypothetical protein